jgi:hypothetical protein
MGFFARFFGGGRREADRGIYLYIQPKRCDEVIRVRIDPYNELSQADEGDGYFVRKLARGARCPFEVEILLRFDKNRTLRAREIHNGAFVDEAAYLARQN